MIKRFWFLFKKNLQNVSINLYLRKVSVYTMICKLIKNTF